MRPSKLKVGDLVLLCTEHSNLQLPIQKLAPKWLGPLKVLELRGPNTVRVEIPPCFARLTPLQNVENLKPYHPSPQEVGPSNEAPPPELKEGEEESEVEDIVQHAPHKLAYLEMVTIHLYYPTWNTAHQYCTKAIQKSTYNRIVQTKALFPKA